MDKKEKLNKVLHSNYIEPKEFVDMYLESGVFLCKFNGYNTYVYGAGKDVDIFIRVLINAGVKVLNIVDRDENKSGEICEGIEIITLDKFLEISSKNCANIFVFVYALIKSDYERDRLCRLMRNIVGYRFVGNERYYRSHVSSAAVSYLGRRYFYKTHKEELSKSLDLLNDDVSKDVFIEYVRAFVECGRYRLPELPTNNKYFYDVNGKEIYTHLEDEVWINCGAEVGTTIMEYFASELTAKKIYAVEGDRIVIDQLKDNISLLHQSINQSAIEIIPKNIDGSGSALEHLKNHLHEITLINADIESNEALMLKEFTPIIQKSRPVLAICAYHEHDDLIFLPQYINSIVTNYQFVLRKYVAATFDCNSCSELVLYAVPNERAALNQGE